MNADVLELYPFMSVQDWVALLVFLLCYFGYPRFLDLIRSHRDRPLRFDVHRELREAVCQNVKDGEGRSLLSAAYQTYARTLIFFGTASLLSLGGALGLFLSSERTHELLTFSVFGRVESFTGARFRLLVFIVFSGFSFVQFVWGLKALYNLTYAVHSGDPATVREYLRYMDIDFTRGVRTLYYLSVLFLWFFGPELLFLGSLALTIILFRYDFLMTKF